MVTRLFYNFAVLRDAARQLSYLYPRAAGYGQQPACEPTLPQINTVPVQAIGKSGSQPVAGLLGQQ